MPMGAGLIDPRYCCCAVPLVNAGIHMILGEQAVVSIVAGVVAIATPTVVGASFPSFGTYIFAICCFLVAAVQPIGFIGVIREKTSTFKVYSLLNALTIAAAFICSAALIIVSALRHNTAVSACETKFFSDTSNSTSTTANQTLASESQQLCSAFAWADVGIMGVLWLILFLLQTYFIFLTRRYSTSQVKDHKLYHSVYSENPEAFTMSILRSTRYNPGSVYNNLPPSNLGPGAAGAGGTGGTGPHADVWDSRPSMESLRDERYGEEYPPGQGPGQGEYDQRQSYYGDGQRQSQYGGGDEGRYDDAPYHGHGQNYPFSEPGGGYVDHPAEARVNGREGITPTANQYTEGQGVGYNSGNGYDYPSSGGGGGLRRPEETQNHPAEGMFGRKSPRYDNAPYGYRE